MARRPRAALCGAGPIAGVHAAAAVLAGVEVTAVASRTLEHASELADRLGARAVPYEVLPAGADLVVVASPPASHLEHLRHALHAGVPAIVERPLATTLADADTMVELASAHGERVLYAENLLHAPVVREFLHHVSRSSGIDRLEVRAETGPVPHRDGVLNELGPSALALAITAAAPQRPIGIRASARLDAEGNDEYVDIDMRFDRGLRAHVVVSRCGGIVPSWSAQASTPERVMRVEIHPHPTLELNGDPVPFPSPTTTLPEIEQYGYRAEWRSFLDDLQHRRRPSTDVAFGRMALELACCAALAVRTGTEAAVPYSGDRGRPVRDIARR